MIITHHVDNRRSGANLNETTLQPGNVNSITFGQIFSMPVMGAIYAQPLYAPGIQIGQGTHNVLFVATMHNMVYAFDADAPGAPLWKRQLGASIPLPDGAIGPSGYSDIEWEVGIVSTPVIDTQRGAMWVVSTSRDQSNTVIHRLWSLNLSSGIDRTAPVTISAQSGSVNFVSHRQLQRSALLLSQNAIYVAFASYGDANPYTGWVLRYDADTLGHSATFCTTPSKDGQGGIWQAGQGPCADDSGNIYFLTGNGDFNTTNHDFGDCAVSLDPALTFRSFFSPHNNQELNDADRDLGSSGLLAIPGTNRVIGDGKEAFLYLMDMNNLGGFNPKTDNVVQKFPVSKTDGGHHIHGSPVFWNRQQGSLLYVWPENDQMKGYRFVNGTFDTTNVIQTTITDPNNFPGGTSGMPGGFMMVSANGDNNGIVWANHPWSQNLNQMIGEGVLRAFDATTLQQIYSSRSNPGRDDFGNFAKFCPPTVANGRIYMATMGGLQRKVTLSEEAFGGPAMASHNQRLVLAWSGTDNPSHLNLMVSSDGLAWGSKVTIPDEKTLNAVGLASDGGQRLFIAWTGGDRRLNVMSSIDPSLKKWGNKHTLDETSNHGPVLAFGNGKLFLAWTGKDNRLNVLVSTDGISWKSKKTLDETSPTEPSLTFHNGVLYLLWNGMDKRLNIVESHDEGVTFGNKITLDETSEHHPAMAFGADGLPRLSWTCSGIISPELNELISETGTVNGFGTRPAYKRVFSDRGSNGPCLCNFNGRVFIGWTGTDIINKVNVAELSRGAVAVYGHL